jgi:hypothetical protein
LGGIIGGEHIIFAVYHVYLGCPVLFYEVFGHDHGGRNGGSDPLTVKPTGAVDVALPACTECVINTVCDHNVRIAKLCDVCFDNHNEFLL